jgi:hypothetical protein
VSVRAHLLNWIFFGLFIHLFIYAHIVWATSPYCALFLPSFLPFLASRQNLFCPLLQFCWREDNKIFCILGIKETVSK